MRPGSLHRVHRPADVRAPIVIEIVKGGVLEELASADTSVIHEEVDSPEVLDGRRDQVTATFRGGNVAVIRDCLASTCPNEVGHLFRDCGVPPEPRYVRPQVVHQAPRSARSSTYARPSPRPAPVTTATFPSNEIRSVISLSSSDKIQLVAPLLAGPSQMYHQERQAAVNGS